MLVTNQNGLQFEVEVNDNKLTLPPDVKEVNDWGEKLVDGDIVVVIGDDVKKLPPEFPEWLRDVRVSNPTDSVTYIDDKGIVKEVKLEGQNVEIPNDAYRLLDWGQLEKNEYGNYPWHEFKLTSSLVSVPNYFPEYLKTIDNMFSDPYIKLFPEIINWDLSGITYSNKTFSNRDLIKEADIISKVRMPNNTSLSSVFENSKLNFNDVKDLVNWEELQYASRLFHKTQFGDKNDEITKLTMGELVTTDEMFSESNFNEDISNWRPVKANRVDGMFRNNTSFNQDLSGWEFPQIALKPTSFDEGASSWELPRPSFGLKIGKPLIVKQESGNLLEIYYNGESISLDEIDWEDPVVEVVDWGEPDESIELSDYFIVEMGASIEKVPDYLPKWITNISQMFSRSTSFNDPNITKWDFSHVTAADQAFLMARSFNQDLSHVRFELIPEKPYGFDDMTRDWEEKHKPKFGKDTGIELTLNSYSFSPKGNVITVDFTIGEEIPYGLVGKVIMPDGEIGGMFDLGQSGEVELYVPVGLSNGDEVKIVFPEDGSFHFTPSEFILTVSGLVSTIEIPSVTDIKVHEDYKTLTGRVEMDEIPEGLKFKLTDMITQGGSDKWYEVDKDGTLTIINDEYFYEGTSYSLECIDMGEDFITPSWEFISLDYLLKEPYPVPKLEGDVIVSDDGKEVTITTTGIFGAKLGVSISNVVGSNIGSKLIPYTPEPTEYVFEVGDPGLLPGEDYIIKAKDMSGKIKEVTIGEFTYTPEPQIPVINLELESYKLDPSGKSLTVKFSSDEDIPSGVEGVLIAPNLIPQNYFNLTTTEEIVLPIIADIKNGQFMTIDFSENEDVEVNPSEFKIEVSGLIEKIEVPYPTNLTVGSDYKTLTGKIEMEEIPEGLSFRVRDFINGDVTEYVDVSENGDMLLVSDFYYSFGNVYYLEFKDLGPEVNVPEGISVPVKAPSYDLSPDRLNISDLTQISDDEIGFVLEPLLGYELTVSITDSDGNKVLTTKIPYGEDSVHVVNSDVKLIDGETYTIEVKDASETINVPKQQLVFVGDTPEEPEVPTDPEEPTEPEVPVDPEEPETPTDPEEPVNPEEPEEPTDPEVPVDPPVDPEEPEENPEEEEDCSLPTVGFHFDLDFPAVPAEVIVEMRVEFRLKALRCSKCHENKK